MKIIAALGDYYHDEDTFKEALSEVTKDIKGAAVLFVAREELVSYLEEKPDVVVLGSENRLNPDEDDAQKWLTKEVELKIADFVKSGGSWLAWHSGLASYESNPYYIDMLGGYFTHHPDGHVSVQYNFEKEHALSKGKTSFEIIDEHYFIKSEKDIKVFLRSISEHGESVAGWTRSYGEGKVCCYTPAHNKEGLMHASVQNNLTQIIKWLSNDVQS